MTNTALLTEGIEQKLNLAVEAVVRYLRKNKRGGSFPLWWVLNELGYSKEHPSFQHIDEVEKRLIEHPNIQWKLERKQMEGKHYKKVLFVWYNYTAKSSLDRYRERYRISAGDRIIPTDGNGGEKVGSRTPAMIKPMVSHSSPAANSNGAILSHDISQSKRESREISMPVTGREGSDMAEQKKKRSAVAETVEQVFGILEKNPNKKFTLKDLGSKLGRILQWPAKLALQEAAMAHPNINVYTETKMRGRYTALEWVSKATVKEWASKKGGKGKKELRAAAETPAAPAVSKVILPSAAPGNKKSAADLKPLLAAIVEAVADIAKEGTEALERRKQLLSEAADLKTVAKDSFREVTRLGRELRRADKQITKTLSRLKRR